MKKGIKKFLIALVFLALAISLVYSAPIIKEKLGDYKIEKVGNKYYTYQLIDITDDGKINEDKEKLKNEKEIVLDKNYLEEFEKSCSNNCKEFCDYQFEEEDLEDCYLKCKEDCEYETFVEGLGIEELIKKIDKEIESLEDKKI